MSHIEIVAKVLDSTPRTIPELCIAAGLPRKSVDRAIRTLVGKCIAEKSTVSNSRQPRYCVADLKGSSCIRTRILDFLRTNGPSAPSVVAKGVGENDDYVRHSLRLLADRYLVRRQVNANGRSMIYVLSEGEQVYGQSKKLTALYECLLPVQRARLAA